MGKLVGAVMAAGVLVQAISGMALADDNKVRSSIGESILWNSPTGPMCNFAEMFSSCRDLLRITAKDACATPVTFPESVYTLTLEDGSLPDTAREALKEKMRVPAVCETGFPNRDTCFSFGEELAKGALEENKDSAVYVSCRRKSDDSVLAGYIGNSKICRVGGDKTQAFRFSGGTRF